MSGRAQGGDTAAIAPEREVRPRLEILCRGELLLRREQVFVPGLKGTGTRILFASDLHLWGSWTERPATQLAQIAEGARPDIILLGGDLADVKGGLQRLTDLVARLRNAAPVYAIPGNHDLIPGERRVRAAVLAGGGAWLPEMSLEIGNAREIRVDANIRKAGPDGAVRILCAHDPGVWPRAREAGYSLVLAGHLHGLQWVFFRRRGRMFPGAWFWRWNGLRFDAGRSTLIVSRGVSDTFPLRWDCPREVVLCELMPFNKQDA